MKEECANCTEEVKQKTFEKVRVKIVEESLNKTPTMNVMLSGGDRLWVAPSRYGLLAFPFPATFFKASTTKKGKENEQEYRKNTY